MEKVKLTENELDILIQALDMWKNNDSELMISMFSMMLPRELLDSEEYKKSEIERKEKLKKDKQVKAEQAALLMAKLVMIKQAIATSDFLEANNT